MVFDDSELDGLTYTKDPYCKTCIESGEMMCREHQTLKILMLEILEDEDVEEEAEEEIPRLTTLDACPRCAHEATLAIPADERERMAKLLLRLGGFAIGALHTAIHMPPGVIKNMAPADRAVFGLTLAAHFYDLSPQDLLFRLFEEAGSTRGKPH